MTVLLGEEMRVLGTTSEEQKHGAFTDVWDPPTITYKPNRYE
jgi:catalase (peroxidase I)